MHFETIFVRDFRWESPI